MRAFIISMPRSGTYLLAELLTNWGMTNTLYHFSQDFLEVRTPESIKEKRLSTDQVKHNPDDYYKKILFNQFAVGHLAPTPTNRDSLRDFKKILLVRDPHECQRSLAEWSEQIGHKIEFLGSHKQIPMWACYEPDIFLLHFDDLISENFNKLDSLQKFLFGDVVYSSEFSIRKSRLSETFTKNHRYRK